MSKGIGDVVWVKRKGEVIRGKITNICHGIHVDIRTDSHSLIYIKTTKDRCFSSQSEAEAS